MEKYFLSKHLVFRKLFYLVTYVHLRGHKQLKGGDIVKEIEVIIDTEEISESFYNELTKEGLSQAKMS